MSGWLIVLEGIDGCGSTTQTARLAARLRECGRDVVTTCEPTAEPVGSMIRRALRGELSGEAGRPRQLDWATLALLFAADRLDHNQTVIEPALRAGRIVVSDRYDLSSLAYQSVTAPEAEVVLPWIRAINARARRPDLTVVIDVAPEVAARRRLARGGATELFEVDALQRQLAVVYRNAEQLVPGDRVVHLSGEGSAESIGAELLSVIEAQLFA